MQTNNEITALEEEVKTKTKRIIDMIYILSDSAVVIAGNIMVGCPTNSSVILVVSDKRICSTFEECSIPFYECMFIRINLWLLLSEFELEVLKFQKVSPSQLYPGAWAFIKAFQF